MVKVNEVTNLNEEKDLPYDVVEDAVVFMRNDPMFYRRHYLPAIMRIADLHRAQKKYNPSKILSPCIEEALTRYCRKYNIARTPEEVFTSEDRSAILQKIYSEEMDQIKRGGYT